MSSRFRTVGVHAQPYQSTFDDSPSLSRRRPTLLTEWETNTDAELEHGTFGLKTKLKDFIQPEHFDNWGHQELYKEGSNPSNEEVYSIQRGEEEGYQEDYPEEGYPEEGYSEEAYPEEGSQEEGYPEESPSQEYPEEYYPSDYYPLQPGGFGPYQRSGRKVSFNMPSWKQPDDDEPDYSRFESAIDDTREQVARFETADYAPGEDYEYYEEEEEEEMEDESAADQPEEEVDPYSETEEDSYVADDISPFTEEQILERVYIEPVPGKGRCAFATRDYTAGSVIYVESPTCVAIPSLAPDYWEILERMNEEAPFSYPPVWQLAALYSLTRMSEEDQGILLNKWVADPDKEPSEDALRVCNEFELGEDAPRLYERFLQVWRFNSFGHHVENDGLVLYSYISMCAHDCGASASWHYGENDAFVLRARRFIPQGGEITISYIGDEDLIRSTHIRRERLSGWMFKCGCNRCSSPIDNCRGFRCPSCGVGTVFVKTETDPLTERSLVVDVNSQPCTSCGAPMKKSMLDKYVGFEQAYISRLDDCEIDDVPDMEAVYAEAQRVFAQHWVMYQLDQMLAEGYKRIKAYSAATMHNQKRINYLTAVSPHPSYTLAWLYESLGDPIVDEEKSGRADPATRAFRRNLAAGAYESAMNMLYVLCGWEHEYTDTAYTKLSGVLNWNVDNDTDVDNADVDNEGDLEE